MRPTLAIQDDRGGVIGLALIDSDRRHSAAVLDGPWLVVRPGEGWRLREHWWCRDASTMQEAHALVRELLGPVVAQP